MISDLCRYEGCVTSLPTCQSTEGVEGLHGIWVICQIELRLRLRLGTGLGCSQPGNLLCFLLQLRPRLPDQRSRPAP